MAVRWVVKLYLVLAVRLVVPYVEAGDWQHCQKVSGERCSVGDSRRGGPKYRYDIEAGAFAKLSHVQTLVIWRSNLQTLKSGTFDGMGGLKQLLLLGNNITCLEAGTFDGLPDLGYLYLVENQILTMPVGMLRGLQSEWLDVSMNSISHIAPGVLDDAGPVRYIYFVKNKLQSVSVGMFAELEQLRLLYLQHNEISSIADGAFLSNQLLETIVLSGNKLTFLSGLWFAPGMSHTQVNVKGNAIAAVFHASRLLHFFVPNNPLRCTCANIGLYELMWTVQKWCPPSRFMISIQTGCPAISLLRTPPVAVNTSALPCPAPFVEIVNVERNQHPQVYKAFGNVYWEDLPHVFWTFANGSEYSMNITLNTNTTAHVSVGIGNLTVSVVTYIKAEAVILMMLTRIAWRYSTEVHRVARQNARENYSVEGAPGPREGLARLPSGSSAIVPYAVAYGDTVANAGSSGEQIAPYAITYDVEDDDITPYAEGHLRDHDSLCESDASDPSEIVPCGVSKMCGKYANGDRKETKENTSVTLSSEGPVPKTYTYGKDEPKETILNYSVNVIVHQPSPSPLPSSDRSEAACSTASPLPEIVAIDTQATPIDTETTDVVSVEVDAKSEQGQPSAAANRILPHLLLGESYPLGTS
ncbi:hypothetical protein Bbelb_379530 [Branchiostoma belcheri]|nr:hypothetical protein Bbelb_379530 [Branchiostoma belcheri]